MPEEPQTTPGFPPLPELTVALTTAARKGPAPEDTEALETAAHAYWQRRGLPTAPGRLLTAAGGPALLLALTAAVGGDVLLPRPCPSWWIPQARLLGRTAHPVAVPAEYGGVPDPYALLETVRRIRAEGGDPRLLLLSVADDPTGTIPEPEALDEVLRAAVDSGLTVVSDETWRDTVHDPAHPVLLSPAAMRPDAVVVLTDLVGAFLPADWPAALARFPDTPEGTRLRARTLDAVTAQGAALAGPFVPVASHALEEGPGIRARLHAANRVHGALARAARDRAVAAGALALPPRVGRGLYVDLEPLRPALAAHGVADSVDLERYLGARLGLPAPGGHRFGDALSALRFRLSTASLLDSTPERRLASLTASEPLELPYVQRALSMFATAFHALASEAGDRTGAERGEPHR